MKLQSKNYSSIPFPIHHLFLPRIKKTYGPIASEKVGNHILYQPQDYIEKELNHNNLFIGCKEGIFIVSPSNGVISSYRYSYPSSLGYGNMLNCDFKTSKKLNRI